MRNRLSLAPVVAMAFGINEAHGRGVAIQLNMFLDSGAVTIADNGRFSADHGLIDEAVEQLTRRLMTIQANGDYEAE